MNQRYGISSTLRSHEGCFVFWSSGRVFCQPCKKLEQDIAQPYTLERREFSHERILSYTRDVQVFDKVNAYILITDPNVLYQQSLFNILAVHLIYN